MRKTLPKNSILVRVIILLAIILIIPFSLLLTFTFNRINIIENESANQYLSSNLQVVSSTIDGILSNLEYNHTSLALNTEFIHTLKNLQPYADREEYTDYKQTNIIKSQIINTGIVSNYIDSVYAYSYLANRIFSSKVNWDASFNNYDFQSSLWLKAYNDMELYYPWTITSSIEDGRVILSSYREIKELDMPLYGLVSINVNENVIIDLLQDINADSDSYCYVTDLNDNYIGSDNTRDSSVYKAITQDLSMSEHNSFQHITVEKEKYFVATLVSDYSNLTYVIASPAKSIENISPLLKTLNQVFIGSTLLIVALFFYIIYKILYSPIKDLFQHMNEVQEGNFHTRLPESSTYEIDYINANFNEMVENIQNLINENYVNQLISKDAQLKAIQSQLNAHFLYNTLDTIHWKARLEDAPETCAMTFALAKFYRLSLSSGKEFISVKDIMEMLENYMQIQKIRMGERFIYTLNAETKLLEYPVLKYLFQPLAENAIIHGCKNLKRQEIIDIRFYEENGYLVYKVSDNGNGIPAGRLKYLTESLKEEVKDTEGLFALKTLHAQLLSHYKGSDGLHIESVPGSGCTIWFKIPSTELQIL